MKLAIHIEVTLGRDEQQPERESSADAVVERSDLSVPPLGFTPNYTEPTYRRDR